MKVRTASARRAARVLEGEEKDAIDAAHEEIVEGDEAGALELEDAEAMLEGLCNRPKVLSPPCGGTPGTEATRGPSSASTANVDKMGGHGEQFLRHLW